MLICCDPEGRDRGVNKLERLWKGPLEVMEHVGRGRYRISAEKGETIVPIPIMRPFRDPVSGNRVPLHFYTYRRVMVDSENFIVENILRHRKQGRKVEWEVQFQRYPETEWHPMESLLHDANEDWQKYNAIISGNSLYKVVSWLPLKSPIRGPQQDPAIGGGCKRTIPIHSASASRVPHFPSANTVAGPIVCAHISVMAC